MDQSQCEEFIDDKKELYLYPKGSQEYRELLVSLQRRVSTKHCPPAVSHSTVLLDL